ncbi:MAG: hypothetical protein DRO01_04755, partial [Thermoproteota archaeon]
EFRFKTKEEAMRKLRVIVEDAIRRGWSFSVDFFEDYLMVDFGDGITTISWEVQKETSPEELLQSMALMVGLAEAERQTGVLSKTMESIRDLHDAVFGPDYSALKKVFEEER